MMRVQMSRRVRQQDLSSDNILSNSRDSAGKKGKICIEKNG